MTRTFAVTWEYRCPFARNAHEHLVTALRAGADWNVTFVPFSLGQVHVDEGGTDVWDDPDNDGGLLALQAGLVVRDRDPDHFLDVHEALFSVRHDHGQDLRDRQVVTSALRAAGTDADAVFDHIADGWPLDVVRKEHEAAAGDHAVWGVPTFIVDDAAVFVRFMHRPEGDATVARTTIERVVDLASWTDLNEFKHTSISR
jgi:hypothetical protein